MSWQETIGRQARGLASIVLCVGILGPAVSVSEAGGMGQALSRGAARGAHRAGEQVLKRDVARDRTTRVTPAHGTQRVFRYTTKARARVERRTGIAPGSHMTARGTAGRPLSARHAQRRYGLPEKPEVRETISLPKGHPVRRNRALGGQPGVGEVTSTKRVPPKAIEKVVPLR